MKKKYLLLLVLLVLIFGGILLLVRSTTHHLSKQAATKPAPLPKEVLITLDKNGFFPSTITVKVGTAVRWKNVSGSNQTVNSDNYPTNQLHKELNFGVFSTGSSVVYVFHTPGTYGYHNQFTPSQKGMITVTQ